MYIDRKSVSKLNGGLSELFNVFSQVLYINSASNGRLLPNKSGQISEGSMTEYNLNRFVDELIEIGDFSKVLEE